MKAEFDKTVLILGIKYAPSILAITCSAKILLLSLSTHAGSPYLYGVNWINWCLNVMALVVFYCMGEYFGFCWKHRSLCRIAGWGYAYYGSFLMFGVPPTTFRPVAVMYAVLVMVLTLIYKEIR